MDPQLACHRGLDLASQGAQQLFDACVDVGAVEGRDAALDALVEAFESGRPTDEIKEVATALHGVCRPWV